MNTPNDTASILYPDDAPAATPPAQTQRQHSDPMSRQPAPADRQAQHQTDRSETARDDQPVSLTYAEDTHFDETAANSMFNQRALAAKQDGNDENAAEWSAAGEALVADFKAAGADHSVFNEALSAFNEADSETLTPEQHAEKYEASMAELQAELGPNLEADLAAARRLIEHLDQQAPGLIASLQYTGAGNHPKLIRAAIAEAKRRGYGRR